MFVSQSNKFNYVYRPGERRRRSDVSTDGEVMTVMRTSLSKAEFASALGMKPDDMFVRKMFNIVDKANKLILMFNFCALLPTQKFSISGSGWKDLVPRVP